MEIILSEVAPQGAPDRSGEVALEATKRLASTLALRPLSLQVGPRRRVHPRLGDGDPVQGQVQLSIALAVQAVALLTSRGSIQGSHPGQHRQLGLIGKPLHPGHLGDQLRGAERAASGELEQLRRWALTKARNSASAALISRARERRRRSCSRQILTLVV
jgi:hypothetical protein